MRFKLVVEIVGGLMLLTCSNGDEDHHDPNTDLARRLATARRMMVIAYIVFVRLDMDYGIRTGNSPYRAARIFYWWRVLPRGTYVTVYRVHLPFPNAKTRDSNEFGYESRLTSIMNIGHSVSADSQATQNQ